MFKRLFVLLGLFLGVVIFSFVFSFTIVYFKDLVFYSLDYQFKATQPVVNRENFKVIFLGILAATTTFAAIAGLLLTADWNEANDKRQRTIMTYDILKEWRDQYLSGQLRLYVNYFAGSVDDEKKKSKLSFFNLRDLMKMQI